MILDSEIIKNQYGILPKRLFTWDTCIAVSKSIYSNVYIVQLGETPLNNPPTKTKRTILLLQIHNTWSLAHKQNTWSLAQKQNTWSLAQKQNTQQQKSTANTESHYLYFSKLEMFL